MATGGELNSITPAEFNELIKRSDTDKIYKILLSSIGAGPFGRGCFIVARAIQMLLGGKIVALVRSDGTADHIAVEKKGLLYNFDGALPPNEFIARFNKNEMAHTVGIVPIEKVKYLKVPKDEEVTVKIYELLRANIKHLKMEEGGCIMDGKKLPLPETHQAFMQVPKGGSCCANCRFLSSDKKDCTNKYFVEWYGKSELPAEIDQYCSDWFEPVQELHQLDKGGLIAPNGKTSNLTKEQYRIVRTPEFKAWFGDWEHSPETASKVVDNNGEPLVVYHFTQKDFTVFNTDPKNELGAHFGNIKQANDLAARKDEGKYFRYQQDGMTGQSILPVFLNLRNPLRLEDTGSFVDVPAVLTDLEEKKVIERNSTFKAFIKRDIGAEELRKIITDKGYDGVVYLNLNEGTVGGFRRQPSGDSYIIFSPSQVKGALTNTSFNSDSLDIRYQEGGTIKMPPDFDRWFAGSKVADKKGNPIMVYRGEHGAGSGSIETRLPMISFGSKKAAVMYAVNPNNKTLDKFAENPKVISAFLSIKNPVINTPDDPFIDFDRIIETVGMDNAEKIAIAVGDYIKGTNNWDDNFSADFRDVKQLIAEHPERLKELYVDAYVIFDEPEFVEMFKLHGYDGLIHGGNGETAMEAEYKVFDKIQVWIVDVASPGSIKKEAGGIALPLEDYLKKLRDVLIKANFSNVMPEEDRELAYQRSNFDKNWASDYRQARDKLLHQYNDAKKERERLKANEPAVLQQTEYAEYQAKLNNAVTAMNKALKSMRAIGMAENELPMNRDSNSNADTFKELMDTKPDVYREGLHGKTNWHRYNLENGNVEMFQYPFDMESKPGEEFYQEVATGKHSYSLVPVGRMFTSEILSSDFSKEHPRFNYSVLTPFMLDQLDWWLTEFEKRFLGDTPMPETKLSLYGYVPQDIKQKYGFQDVEMLKQIAETAIHIFTDYLCEVRGGNPLGSDRETYDKIVFFYRHQPIIKWRSSNSIMLQQYSTPIPIAYLMSRFAIPSPLVPHKKYLEPSAGTGLLTINTPPWLWTINEIDKERLQCLKFLGFTDTYSRDANGPLPEEWHKQYDAVLTNPPFGNTSDVVSFDGYQLKQLEHKMAAYALECMKDSGRSGIIIGNRMRYDEETGLIIPFKPDRVFFAWLYKNYNVVDVINVSGGLYSKMGASFPIRVILIDGVAKPGDREHPPFYDEIKNLPPEATYSPVEINDWDILYLRMRKY